MDGIVKSWSKWSHFKMKLGKPFERNDLARHIPQTFGIFELGKTVFGRGQSSTVFQTTVAKLTGKQKS